MPKRNQLSQTYCHVYLNYLFFLCALESYFFDQLQSSLISCWSIFAIQAFLIAMKLDLLSFLSCCHLMILFFLVLNHLSLLSLFSIHHENAYLKLQIHFEEFRLDLDEAYLIIFVEFLVFLLLLYPILNLILLFYFDDIGQDAKNATCLCSFDVLRLLTIKVHFIQ
jgi:hypothetical protein